MDDVDRQRTAALERVKTRRDFTTHCVAYVMVNSFLVLIWAVTGASYFWPIWSIGGGGVGVAMNAWSVYLQKPITEEDIRHEMERGV